MIRTWEYPIHQNSLIKAQDTKTGRCVSLQIWLIYLTHKKTTQTENLECEICHPSLSSLKSANITALHKLERHSAERITLRGRTVCFGAHWPDLLLYLNQNRIGLFLPPTQLLHQVSAEPVHNILRYRDRYIYICWKLPGFTDGFGQNLVIRLLCDKDESRFWWRSGSGYEK